LRLKNLWFNISKTKQDRANYLSFSMVFSNAYSPERTKMAICWGANHFAIIGAIPFVTLSNIMVSHFPAQKFKKP